MAISVETLLERARGRENKTTVSVEVPLLNDSVVVNKLPIEQVMRIIDSVGDAVSSEEGLKAQLELIYRLCPIFQTKELREAYSVVEPYEVVARVLDDNIGAISGLSEAILDLYGMNDTVDDLKN